HTLSAVPLRHLFCSTHPATPGVSTLSLHDALPICAPERRDFGDRDRAGARRVRSDVVLREVRVSHRDLLAADRPSPPIESSADIDRKSTRLNSSHVSISYAGFCLKKKKITDQDRDT